ncbi:cysteine hydrolase [Carboxylicivirga sediminis]|uniref:Cysteine hydrolase n=1 Tax=Carboxylicivirga sediminis TaxID=2006564 RepID=A0A941IX59_9BACT|nr:cysteine hydrolase family protein [Carboxylicivirga sediminis]MBR8535243.1 cysteine hydrolase [Carboxylicivirga sediminis]
MRTVIILIAIISSFSYLNAQEPDKTALILIDIQDFYFEGGAVELVNAQVAGEQAQMLLQLFRDMGLLVVHVKHKASKGSDINKVVWPLENEKVIEKTEVNAFIGTDLKEYLDAHQIEHIVMAGMQTHMCLEAGVRAAADFGYKVSVVEDACATRDLSYNGVVIPAEQVHFSTLSTLRSYAHIMKQEVFREKFLN